MNYELTSEDATRAFGVRLGGLLAGGAILELVGDVGAGKTTLTKGIAAGMGVSEDVQSPSFTISRVYDGRDGLQLSHYDFYRLGDAGIMADELHETIHDPRTVTVIEWAGIVSGVLPADRLTLSITSPQETVRHITLTAGGEMSRQLLGKVA